MALFIKWNEAGYKSKRSRFMLCCNTKDCECQTLHSDYFLSTPMAYSFGGLNAAHTYKLVVELGEFRHDLVVETKGKMYFPFFVLFCTIDRATAASLTMMLLPMLYAGAYFV